MKNIRDFEGPVNVSSCNNCKWLTDNGRDYDKTKDFRCRYPDVKNIKFGFIEPNLLTPSWCPFLPLKQYVWIYFDNETVVNEIEIYETKEVGIKCIEDFYEKNNSYKCMRISEDDSLVTWVMTLRAAKSEYKWNSFLEKMKVKRQ